MEFLEKLYSQEYFAPVLFVIIAILAVLFVIVLILALRDAKKNKEMNVEKTEDTFAKIGDEPQEINININQENENEVKEDSVINSVEPVSNSFENVEIAAPVAEEIEKPMVTEVKEDLNSIPMAPVGSQDIKLEDSPVATSEEVAKAENDLDAIASTLLSEYQKDNAIKTNVSEVEPTPQPDQFSSVYVTPNTLPNEVEKSSVDLPNLNDIPTPQPVRVTETSTVIDSSKQNANNIEVEEYSINR